MCSKKGCLIIAGAWFLVGGIITFFYWSGFTQTFGASVTLMALPGIILGAVLLFIGLRIEAPAKTSEYSTSGTSTSGSKSDPREEEEQLKRIEDLERKWRDKPAEPRSPSDL